MVGHVIVGPDVDDRSMVVVAAVVRRVIEDRSTVGEPGHRVAAGQVIDTGGRRSREIRRVGQIIGSVHLVHERSLEIPEGVDRDRGPVHTDHIRIQFDDPGVPRTASAEIQVGLAIVVDEGGGVEDIGDRRDTRGTGGDQRVSEGIGERARRGGAPEDADTAPTVAVVDIVIVVPEDGIRGVEGAGDGGGFPFIGPVHEVIGGDEREVVHVISGLAGDIVGAIDIHPVVEPRRGGVCRVFLVDQRVGGSRRSR